MNAVRELSEAEQIEALRWQVTQVKLQVGALEAERQVYAIRAREWDGWAEQVTYCEQQKAWHEKRLAVLTDELARRTTDWLPLCAVPNPPRDDDGN